MPTDACDIVDVVVAKLIEAGLVLDPATTTQDDVIAALSQVNFTKRELRDEVAAYEASNDLLHRLLDHVLPQRFETMPPTNGTQKLSTTARLTKFLLRFRQLLLRIDEMDAEWKNEEQGLRNPQLRGRGPSAAVLDSVISTARSFPRT